MPKDPEDKSIWHLITTPIDTLHVLHFEHGINRIGDLCAMTEDDLSEIVDRYGLMGIKRDLAHMGLSLADAL